jgi:hypothetical protein
MRQALKAAQDAQFSKEGEVSILRKGMEKVSLVSLKQGDF